MNLQTAIHEALVHDQARAYERRPPSAPPVVVRKRKPIKFADRVRFSPRAGDLFKTTAHGESFWFEVEFISGPWVMYKKWSPRDPVKKCAKVQLGAWRDNLSRAQIEEIK
jgi:hypothetical protein